MDILTAKTPEAKDPHGKISMDEQLAGYVEAELMQGYGLNQISEYLLQQGYNAISVTDAVKFIENEKKVSQKDKTKAVHRTPEHHFKRRFLIPIIIIFILIISVFGIISLFGGADSKDSSTKSSLTNDIDIQYAKLGLNSQDYEVKSSKKIMNRIEEIDARKARAVIQERSNSEFFSNTKYDSDVIDSVEKEAVEFQVLSKKNNAIEYRTNIGITIYPKKDASRLNIIELIPISLVSDSSLIILPQGGIVAQENVLQWTKLNVKKGEEVIVNYVIKKKISSIESITIPAVSVLKLGRSKTVCGNNKCEIGENYLKCCRDCGCLTGFKCENNMCSSQKTQINQVSPQPITKETTPVQTVQKTSSQTNTTTTKATTTTSDPTTNKTNTIIATNKSSSTTTKVTKTNSQPKIDFVKVTPNKLTFDELMLVEAKVTDADGSSDIKEVWMEVKELMASYAETSPMYDDGNSTDLYPEYEDFYGSDDKKANDGVYTIVGYVSDYYMTGTYNLVIYAKDSAGKVKKSTTFTVS